MRPKLKLCLFHPTDPRKYPRPKNFYSYFVLKLFFFFVYFGGGNSPKNHCFRCSVLLHSTESDATSLDSDSSQPIICLVLQEPPETAILLADIFSSVAATWNPFPTFVFDKNDRFQCRKGSELADASLSF